MSRLSDTQRGILLSSMSDASCAMTLGRSIAWVARQRLDLQAPQAAPVPAVAPAAPRRTPEARSPKPEARSPRVRPAAAEVKAVRPVNARIARWADWFVQAGWTFDATAELFDVCPSALEEALGRG